MDTTTRTDTMDTTTTVKPGYRTTEFWLSLLAMLLGALFASGLLKDADPTQHSILQVLGMVASILGALGYTVSRGLVKAADSKASAAGDVLTALAPTAASLLAPAIASGVKGSPSSGG